MLPLFFVSAYIHYLTMSTSSLRNDLEIMAPVGSYESLMAAIKAGTGSVYFGIEGLNMRARSANNFTPEDMFKICGICQEHGVKSYLTVNTIIYDQDLSLMRSIIDSARQAGISAIIASDVAAMQYARQVGVEVHLSTQLNICNVESLKFYAQFADVVVLARELNLQQVHEIYQAIQAQQIKGPNGQLIRIEMFAHGALCMAVSGKCYLSLHEVNSSANRGACGQMCRRAYTVKDKDSGLELDIENEYIMSPKDLKTIHFLNKMIDAGVRVFKIEGRARGPEYVHTVVKAYRQAIDCYCEQGFDHAPIEAWDRELSSVFNRGFWDGYYGGKRLGEWTSRYGSDATKEKVYIGKVNKYYSNIGVAEMEMQTGTLAQHDRILITGTTTGLIDMTVDEIRFDLEPVPQAHKGQVISFRVPEKVRPNDKVYLFRDRPLVIE